MTWNSLLILLPDTDNRIPGSWFLIYLKNKFIQMDQSHINNLPRAREDIGVYRIYRGIANSYIPKNDFDMAKCPDPCVLQRI